MATRFLKCITVWGILFAINSVYSQSFSKYFENKSLRVDFQLYGDSKTSKAIVAQLKEEPYWGGSQKELIFQNYGMFRVQILDKNTQELLFSKGFSSLFNEWKNTKKAKKEVRFFYHSMQIPFPKKEIVFVLQQRNFMGKFITLLQKNIHPKNYFIIREKPKKYNIVKLLENGKPTKKIDIAILAEGYTKNEMDKFRNDANEMMNYMFTIPPFNKLKDNFNVYAIESESLESGTDIPGEHIYKNTIFNSSFYTFDMARYLTITDMKSVADVASLVPYDQIYILVNTTAYGGGAFYNHLNVATSGHQLSKKVFVHEFGHGFVGLADEYYDSSTAFDKMYNKNVEPWEPNITTLVNFKSKWKDMLEEGIPIPTPAVQKYKNKVGVFEGGGYVAKGIYRPVQDCRMKSNIPKGFCPVCERAIKNTINKLIDE